MTKERARELVVEKIMDFLDGYDIWPVITPHHIRAELQEVWECLDDEEVTP